MKPQKLMRKMKRLGYRHDEIRANVWYLVEFNSLHLDEERKFALT